MIANPWVILTAVALFAVSIAGTGWKAYQMGRDHEIASQAKAAEVERRATDAALKVTAEAIAGIEVKSVTIRQRTEKEIERVPVYRNCVAGDSVLELTNAAILGTEPPGDSVLPGAGGDDGGDLR